MAFDLQSPTTTLKGVGPQMAAKLARLHVNKVQDVLFHLPHRYEDRTSVTEIGTLLPGLFAVVIGQVELAQVVFARRRSLLVRISDGTGGLTLRLFYFSRAQEKAFKRGLWVRCYGEVRRGTKEFEMIHPIYRVYGERPQGGLDTALTPVYPSTEGVSQQLWRTITSQVLKEALPDVTDLLVPACLPETLQGAHRMVSLQAALSFLHRPPPGSDLLAMQTAQSPAQQRLIFEELLAHHLSLLKARALRSTESAPYLAVDNKLTQRYIDRLPFALTSAQQRVVGEVARDMASSTPMMRLVQGDVGSGKTVVAALALLQAAVNRCQAVLMAPTELLAEQHFDTLSKWFQPLGYAVGWVASKTPPRQKKQTLQALASGELLIAVGTHALFQDSVTYRLLGLVVIDEQHRFGVDQRLALRDKTPDNFVPHQLAMTATPIPRTLAMSVYADLDVSSIDELPPGRKPVDTVVMSAERKRDAVIERARAACQTGRQVYWVCPLIEESDALAAQAATDTYRELCERLPELRIDLVHGRLKPAEKEAAMEAFRQSETDVLIATTVIEVGVDVPNASLMVVENAERMGLAQLHQLRGRVGRGHLKSYCILLYQAPLSQQAKQRLNVLRDTNDGFKIAEQDLSMRGAGELLGTRQTGALSFRIADIIRDKALLPELPASAATIMRDSPDKVEQLIERWTGSRENYANA